jgi:hypothetical protein
MKGSMVPSVRIALMREGQHQRGPGGASSNYYFLIEQFTFDISLTCDGMRRMLS